MYNRPSLNALFFLMLVIVAAIKIYFANTGFLNFEALFPELARSFTDPSASLKDTFYFSWQANPIGTSLIQSVFYVLFPGSFVNYLGIFSRLPAILILFPLAYVLRTFFTRLFNLDTLQASLLSLLVIVHPFIWNFTGRSTSDSFYIPLCITIFALYLEYLKEETTKKVLAISALFAFGVFIKLNILAILGVLGLHTFIEKFKFKPQDKSIVKSLFTDKRLLIAAATIIGFISYSVLITVLDLPILKNDESLHHYKVSFFLRNYLYYNQHFFIASIPCSIISLFYLLKLTTRKQAQITAAASVIITVAIAYFFPGQSLLNTGELGFGGMIDSILAKIVPVWHYPFLFLSTLFLLLALVRLVTIKIKREEAAIILLLMLSIALHSMLKPVQRYLLFFVFLHLSLSLVYLQNFKINLKNSYLTGLLFVFLGVSVLLSVNNKFKSDAYQEFGIYIDKTYENNPDFWLHSKLDPGQFNFYGNVKEKYISGTKPLNYCVYENLNDESVVVRKYNSLTRSEFTISLKKCN